MSAAGSAGPGRRDARIALLALALLLAWEAGGLDRRVSHVVGGTAGFPWRDAWFTRQLLHDGGRWAAAAVLLALVAQALRRHPADPLGAPARWSALGVLLLNLLAVPAFKRASATSCPWDLAEFGGTARFVAHWSWGVFDGGPGHCFPSGHAVAAFAFFAMAFAWRETHPAIARRWLAATLAAGALFGTAQVLRGAHFVSHVAWSAWICWTLAAGADALKRRRRRRLALAAPAAGSRA